MRRRLTLAMLLLVAATLVVTSIGSYYFIRRAAISTAQQQLVGQARAISRTISDGTVSTQFSFKKELEGSRQRRRLRRSPSGRTPPRRNHHRFVALGSHAPDDPHPHPDGRSSDRGKCRKRRQSPGVHGHPHSYSRDHCVYPGAGHYPKSEQSGRTVSAISGWWVRLPSSLRPRSR